MLKKWKNLSRKRKLLIISLTILASGFLIPENFHMPVNGAHQNDYNQKSFWYYPWGKSGTHKGVDIFAKEGTSIFATTSGVVIYKGVMGRGGNVIIVLGPKWRLHYYAHLQDFTTILFDFVSAGEQIGTVGTTGNAKGKPPHLHYSIMSFLPYFWRADGSPQGWKKMFYLDPTLRLNCSFTSD